MSVYRYTLQGNGSSIAHRGSVMYVQPGACAGHIPPCVPATRHRDMVVSMLSSAGIPGMGTGRESALLLHAVGMAVCTVGCWRM